MKGSNITIAAQILREADSTKMVCSPIREWIGVDSIEDAYVVQFINTDLRLKKGAKIIGKKIGLTSLKVQQQLSVNQPDFGILFDDMEIKNEGSISFLETMQPKVEAEIAFVLKKDILSLNPSLFEIETAIDYAVAAIEIVGSRIANWNIKITDTIADNASASHFVLGSERKKLSEIDVVHCKMKMELNSKVVSEGSGADCLGSPLIATQWLAKKMAVLGCPLKAGDIILSGALGPMATVISGDRVSANIEGLGEVAVQFTS